MLAAGDDYGENVVIPQNLGLQAKIGPHLRGEIILHAV